jgi:hypothetical protein
MSNKDSDEIYFNVLLKDLGNSKAIIFPKKYLQEKITGFYCTIENNQEIHLVPGKLLKLEELFDLYRIPFSCKVSYDSDFRTEIIEFLYKDKKIETLLSGEFIRSTYDLALFFGQYLFLDIITLVQLQKHEFPDSPLNAEGLDIFSEFCAILEFSEKRVLYDSRNLLINFLKSNKMSYEVLKEKKMLFNQVKKTMNAEETNLRMVQANEPIKSLNDVQKFLNKGVEDHIIWGYTTIDKEIPCDYVFIYKTGNPEQKFYGILKVDGIIDRDEIDIKEWEQNFRDSGLNDWLEDPTHFKKFFRVIDCVKFEDNSSIGAMENFHNNKDEILTTPGKIRTGNFIIYKGSDPLILDFIGD